METKKQRELNRWTRFTAVFLLGGSLLVAGCDENNCANCVEPVPVAPTGVYSESGDKKITVYWSDFSEAYGSIDHYRIYSRLYQAGDENDPQRIFYEIARVPVGVNYNAGYGQYYYVDQAEDVVNGTDFEYAVSAVSISGVEGDLSFELIIDTPLPMSETPIQVWDIGSANPQWSGFDFRTAAFDPDPLGLNGRVDPTLPGSSADVRFVLRDDVFYLEATRADVAIQDYGIAADQPGDLYFALLSHAPTTGYSATGVLELIEGHIYAIKIMNEVAPNSVHYAKLGAVQIDTTQRSLTVMWAYQLVDGLTELSVPQPPIGDDGEFVPIRL